MEFIRRAIPYVVGGTVAAAFLGNTICSAINLISWRKNPKENIIKIRLVDSLHDENLRDILISNFQRKTEGSAGFDLCTTVACQIDPGERKMIPTGIMIEIPPDHFGLLRLRSSIALRTALVIEGGVIDSDFRDQIQMILHNCGGEPIFFHEGQPIAQIVIIKHMHPVELEYVCQHSTTGRKGGFGSTDSA